MFSLTTCHFIIVKHTVEQQTHVLDCILGTTLTSPRQIILTFSLREKKQKTLGKSVTQRKNKVHLDTFQPCCATSLFRPSTQANSKNHCQSYCCLDHPPTLRLGKPLWRCDGKIPPNPWLPLMAGFGKAKEE